MPDSVLDELRSDDLQANACAFTTAPALRLYFLHRPEVWNVAEGLQRGAITEDAIREFILSLQSAMQRSVLFRHDLTFAALAVALERRNTDFVDPFLRELAGLNIAELPLSPRVAAEVLKRRSVLPSNQSKIERVTDPPSKVITGFRDLASCYPYSSEDRREDMLLEV